MAQEPGNTGAQRARSILEDLRGFTSAGATPGQVELGAAIAWALVDIAESLRDAADREAANRLAAQLRK